MNSTIDKIIVIASISLLLSLYGTIAVGEAYDIPQPSGAATEAIREPYTMSSYHQAYLWHTKMRVWMALTDVGYRYESEGTFEEEVSEEMNCLMYATVPIGKYYITAYNHEETGSKKTASGKTCHEGTITTCAADVWGGYFRFGDYVEITVNGEPRIYRIEDTGSAVKKRHIDIYFASYKEMARYGSNYQEISRVEFPFGKPKEA